MKSYTKIINATKFAGGITLLIGLSIFIYGCIILGSNAIIGIGIGTIMGAVFIFLMGMFFVATEEMIEKEYKGIPVPEKKRRSHLRVL